MSLYESFFIAQRVSNVITFILMSRRLYVGVLCINLHSNTTLLQPNRTNTPVHTETKHYTHIQSSAPEDECNNIRNMLSNKKAFIKWHQVGSVYSTSMNMHGPINIWFTWLCCFSESNACVKRYLISFLREVESGGKEVNQSLVSKMGNTGLGHGQSKNMIRNTYLSWWQQSPWCDFWKLYVENIRAYILAVRIGLKMATYNN